MKNIIIAVLAAGALFFIYNKISARPGKIVNLNNNGSAIVCLGDSITRGEGAGEYESFPSLLQKRTTRPVINLGVNGDTAPAGLARINEIDEHEPFMVLIKFGGNDLIRRVPFEQTVRAVEQMVDYVQRRGAIAVIVETGGNPLMSKYGKAYKKIARRKGAIFIPAIMQGILGNPKLKSDRIHPNAEGYKIIEERIYERIKNFI